MDPKTVGLVGIILVVLATASGVVRFLRRGADTGIDPAIVETFRGRVWAWWLLFAGIAGAALVGKLFTILLFGGISFWALREFITLTPTRPGDHRTLFWVFFLCTPLQFLLVGTDSRWLYLQTGLTSYDVFSIFIPVYAFLLIPVRIAMSGDSKRFLERTAKIQAGLLICVYCLSYAPALLTMDLSGHHLATINAPRRIDEANHNENPPSREEEELAEPSGRSADEADATEAARASEAAGSKTRLLLFLVLVVQLSDALQYAWSKLRRRHVIVPSISPSRTWEGLLGGTLSTTLVGAALSFVTPLGWWQGAAVSFVVSLTAFAGVITMSAIKRDRGVKDYGTLVEGHGGVLDRIDSLCFSAPVFYHLTWYFLVAPAA
jgi:phosphatidate cytidylyltransferase